MGLHWLESYKNQQTEWKVQKCEPEVYLGLLQVEVSLQPEMTAQMASRFQVHLTSKGKNDFAFGPSVFGRYKVGSLLLALLREA